tara:strand:- start:43 stop:366 length:324 start_codon:yes stop_codon:yes gene_type:complete
MNTKFTFTDEEFIFVINLILKLDAPLGEEYIPIQSLEDRVDMGRLDSLGMIVLFVWLSHLFGISEDQFQTCIRQGNLTIQRIKEFVIANCTKNCTLDDVKEYAERCI